MRGRKNNVSVSCADSVDGLPASKVRRVVSAVLAEVGVDAAEFSVTFHSSQKMRALNRRHFGRDRATDVISFGLPHPGTVVGDVYVCPAKARQSALDQEVSLEEELTRLVVHGVLHALGFDHPKDVRRTQSEMWHTQETCVRRVMRGGR